MFSPNKIHINGQQYRRMVYIVSANRVTCQEHHK